MDEEKIELFERTPVGKAIAALAVPTVISQLITTIYNLADTFFVGQLNDPDQVAAIALALPVQMSMTALANLFGIGGGTLFSRALGARDAETARKTTAFSVYGALTVMTLYAVLVALFREAFLTLLGSTPELHAHTGAYVFWVLILGGVPSVFNMVAAHIIRAEGASREASIGLSMGGILNMVLDPVFIFAFGMELRGAAIATFLSNCASTVYFVRRLWKIRRTTVISLSPRHFTLERQVAVPVLQVGLPSALQMLLSMVSNMVLNNVLSGFHKTAVAAIGICKKIDSIPIYVLMGITQGVVPLLAYSHGAGNRERQQKTLRYTICLAVGFAAGCLALLQIAPAAVAAGFIKDAQTVEYAAMFIRIHSSALPFSAIAFLMVGYFQAVGESRCATVLSSVRKGVFDVPLMFLMNVLVPLYGPVMCQPIMDLVTTICAAVMYRQVKRSLVDE
ncbi:MAG: MATE family efflux transporter [Oscillibacter sp.]|nr:MATE family efflux transporter [Oscillibacter sp.]